MSKIRLLQNKETLAALILGSFLLVVFLVNIGILVPELLQLYLSKSVSSGKSPIDAQVIQKAVDDLSE